MKQFKTNFRSISSKIVFPFSSLTVAIFGIGQSIKKCNIFLQLLYLRSKQNWVGRKVENNFRIGGRRLLASVPRRFIFV